MPAKKYNLTQGLPSPKIVDVGAPSRAAAQVGGAISDLGGTVANVGAQLEVRKQKIQEERDQVDARIAKADFAKAEREIRWSMFDSTGVDARGTGNRYLEETGKALAKLSSNLTTQRSRDLLKNYATARVDGGSHNVHKHEAAEGIRAQKDANALFSLAKEGDIQEAGANGDYAAALKHIDIRNLETSGSEAEKAVWAAGAVVKMLESSIATSDPDRVRQAEEFIDKNETEFSGKVLRGLRGQIKAFDKQQEANKKLAGDLEDRKKEAVLAQYEASVVQHMKDKTLTHQYLEKAPDYIDSGDFKRYQGYVSKQFEKVEDDPKIRTDLMAKVNTNPKSITDKMEFWNPVFDGKLTPDTAEDLQKDWEKRLKAPNPPRDAREKLIGDGLKRNLSAGIFDVEEDEGEATVEGRLAGEEVYYDMVSKNRQFFTENPDASETDAKNFYDNLMAPYRAQKAEEAVTRTIDWIKAIPKAWGFLQGRGLEQPQAADGEPAKATEGGEGQAPTGTQPQEQAKIPVRTGTLDGRKVVEFSDGSFDYAD